MISYVVKPFYGRHYNHTNFQESLVIAKIFDILGFVVDVTNYDNEFFVVDDEYDIIFGFGYPLERSLELKNTLKICYATGAYHHFQNNAEIKRIKSVSCKYGFDFKPKRTVLCGWSDKILNSEFLIIYGNDWTRHTYANIKSSKYLINGTYLDNSGYVHVGRDGEDFLWMGGAGLIHKGLDLVLECFADRPQLKLHICGPREDDFFRCFAKFLKLPNIKYHGYVDVSSSQFIDIVRSCQFSILPSCSEGQATSVLTSMYAGLIPIVTDSCGVDIYDFGTRIAGLEKRDVMDAIDKASCLTSDQKNNMSKKAYEYTKDNHSIEKFRERFFWIIKDILLRNGYVV